MHSAGKFLQTRGIRVTRARSSEHELRTEELCRLNNRGEICHSGHRFDVPIGDERTYGNVTITVCGELSEVAGPKGRMFDLIRESSLTWDGVTDPVRPFPDLSKI